MFVTRRTDVRRHRPLRLEHRGTQQAHHIDGVVSRGDRIALARGAHELTVALLAEAERRQEPNLILDAG